MQARWHGYGIHSPFIFSFYQFVLKPPVKKSDKLRIKKILNRYKNDKTIIDCPSLGAGSVYKAANSNKVRSFIKQSSVDSATGKVLYNIARYFKPGKILELGTGLGLSTVYLSMGHPDGMIKTVEGCREKLEYATKLFKEEGLVNIQTKNGKFGEELPTVLKEMKLVDLVYIDGDHQYDPTLSYFNMINSNCHNNSIIVIDDIHWSPGMEKAWKQIQQHPDVRVTIDLFRLGIVLYKKELSRQNFIIKY